MTTRAKDGVLHYHSHLKITVPDTVSEALQFEEWKKVMTKEYTALMRNDTWALVPYSSDMNLISTKWIFRIKYTKDGGVERYKARLVARGFQQNAGIDFFQTYSPVVKPVTLRLIFSITITFGWGNQQVDIDNVFINGQLKETVYISQPEGFVDESKPSHVCKLIKALYGLKQAPKAWYDTFRSFLLKIGFQNLEADHCLFIKRVHNKLLLLLMYVYDILTTGDDHCLIFDLIGTLSHTFSLKYLGGVTTSWDWMLIFILHLIQFLLLNPNMPRKSFKKPIFQPVNLVQLLLVLVTSFLP